MHRYLIALVLLALSRTGCSDTVQTISNATELRDFLKIGRQPLSLEPVSTQRGCGPSGCSIDVGGVSIMREQGILLDTDSKKPIQIHAQSSGDLPEIDWDPLGGFVVSRSGQRWGTCLEFSHTGLGKSGRYQRWTSVLLVPWSNSHPGQLAYRFVGYWAGCDFLMAGNKADEISLPTLEPDGENQKKSLDILWHACNSEHCNPSKDTRIVTEDAESGALKVGYQYQPVD